MSTSSPIVPPPSDLVVIECIEFNARYRCADPVADITFLVMDLARRGLAGSFADAYFQAAGDAEGRALLPFYTAYRAAVRGKVEGVEFLEPEVPESERTEVLVRARAHWLLALSELERPGRRPCLALVGGLPRTGRTILARGLAERAGFAVIRSDLVRKELTGISPSRGAASAFEAGIYAPAWTERTYADRGGASAGGRELPPGRKSPPAPRGGDPVGRPGPAPALSGHAGGGAARLERRRDDDSDANWFIYQRAAARWEEPEGPTSQATREISTDEGEQLTVARALDELRKAGLLEEV